MSKFAVGEKVDNAADDHEVGTVIAVFPTVDGNFRYRGRLSSCWRDGL
jgi:hypothetical protein